MKRMCKTSKNPNVQDKLKETITKIAHSFSELV